jgi:hypothetical protein
MRERPPPPPKPLTVPAVLPEDVFTATEFCTDLPSHTLKEITRVDDMPFSSRTLPTAEPAQMISLLFRLTLLRGSPLVVKLKEVPKEKLRAVLHQYCTANGKLHKGGWMRTVETLLPKGTMDRNTCGRIFDAYMKGANTDIDAQSFSNNIGFLLDYHEPFAMLMMCFVLFDPHSRAPRYCTRLELETMVRVYDDEVTYCKETRPAQPQTLHHISCLEALKRVVSRVYYDLKGRVDVNEFVGYVREDLLLSAALFPKDHTSTSDLEHKPSVVIDSMWEIR